MPPLPATAAPFAVRALLLAAPLLAAGCAIAPPEVDAGADIARALELDGAIAFRGEAGPLDVVPVDGELGAADAIRRALESSAELQAALARVRVAQMDAELAGLLPNPVLDVVLRFPAGHGGTDVDAGLSADLLAFVQRPGRASAAGHRLQAAAAGAVSTALDVVARAQSQYVQAQVLEELVPVLEERVAVFDRLAQVARVRLEVGEGSRHDVTAIEAERASLVLELEQRRQELRLARLSLARQVGEPSSAAAWRLEPWCAPESSAAPEPDWIAAALASRPEVAALRWEIRALLDEADLAGGLVWSGSELSVQAEREDDWSVGPGLAVPLPLSGAGDLQTERARALVAEAGHRLVEAERSVVEDVRAALETLRGAQASLERVRAELLPLQQQRRDDVAQAFELGASDVTDVLVAEQALQDAHARRIELERDVSLAWQRLQRSAGGPLAVRTLPNTTAQSAPAPSDTTAGEIP